jgi:hypothetical protein
MGRMTYIAAAAGVLALGSGAYLAMGGKAAQFPKVDTSAASAPKAVAASQTVAGAARRAADSNSEAGGRADTPARRGAEVQQGGYEVQTESRQGEAENPAEKSRLI